MTTEKKLENLTKEVKLIQDFNDYLEFDRFATLDEIVDLNNTINELIEYSKSINKQYALFYIVITNCLRYTNYKDYANYKKVFGSFDNAFRDALCSVELYNPISYESYALISNLINTEEDLQKILKKNEVKEVKL